MTGHDKNTFLVLIPVILVFLIFLPFSGLSSVVSTSSVGIDNPIDFGTRFLDLSTSGEAVAVDTLPPDYWPTAGWNNSTPYITLLQNETFFHNYTVSAWSSSIQPGCLLLRDRSKLIAQVQNILGPSEETSNLGIVCQL